jgi:hypothetical protein
LRVIIGLPSLAAQPWIHSLFPLRFNDELLNRFCDRIASRYDLASTAFVSEANGDHATLFNRAFEKQGFAATGAEGWGFGCHRANTSWGGLLRPPNSYALAVLFPGGHFESVTLRRVPNTDNVFVFNDDY